LNALIFEHVCLLILVIIMLLYIYLDFSITLWTFFSRHVNAFKNNEWGITDACYFVE